VKALSKRLLSSINTKYLSHVADYQSPFSPSTSERLDGGNELTNIYFWDEVSVGYGPTIRYYYIVDSGEEEIANRTIIAEILGV
jgi:hypothetical protein